MEPEQLAMFIKGGGSLISYFIGNQPVKLTETKVTEKAQTTTFTVEKPPEKPAVQVGVSTEETIAYQKREISKELLLMEKHLQQHCKISGVACDCCGGKHLITIEGLAQETLGMTGDPVYNELVDWTKVVTPLTTANASASGKYEDKYPELALQAREMRKRIMGTADIMPLLDPAQQKRLKEVVDA
jgi:hypothetical protein